MNSSPEINELCTALSLAQAKFKPAVKNKTNPHYKSKYADLDSVMDAVRDHLAANGLSIIQGVSSTPERLVRITTRLMHKSGQWIEDYLDLRPDKDAIQQIGSAISYGRRYALSAMLGVTTDEDDDGNAAQAQKDAEARKRAFAVKCNELGVDRTAWHEIAQRLKDSGRGVDDIQDVLTEMEHERIAPDELKQF